MRDLLALLLHLLATLARLLGPGGTRAVIAETLLIKHQLFYQLNYALFSSYFNKLACLSIEIMRYFDEVLMTYHAMGEGGPSDPLQC